MYYLNYFQIQKVIRNISPYYSHQVRSYLFLPIHAILFTFISDTFFPPYLIYLYTFYLDPCAIGPAQVSSAGVSRILNHPPRAPRTPTVLKDTLSSLFSPTNFLGQ